MTPIYDINLGNFEILSSTLWDTFSRNSENFHLQLGQRVEIGAIKPVQLKRSRKKMFMYDFCFLNPIRYGVIPEHVTVCQNRTIFKRWE
jgi:hypothetical protein